MADVATYLKLSASGAAFCDAYFNQTTSESVPSFYVGTKQNLILNCGYSKGSPADFSDIVSWEFVIDPDYDTTNDPKFAVSSGITASAGAITIPLVGLNTAALSALVSSSGSASVPCELVGYKSGEIYPSVILQFSITLKARRIGSGTASSVALSDFYYTAAQTIAGFIARVTGAIEGNLAAVDANGGLSDSGKKASDFAAAAHTQAASTITDFAASVAENAAVAANTEARHSHSNMATLDAIPAFGSGTIKFLREDGTFSTPAGSGSGDLVGPPSATDGHLFAADGTTGKLAKDSGIPMSSVSGHIASTANPHGVTASQVGLGNVPNTDATNASNISSGTLNAARLPDSGVTAGTAGSSTAVPVITYDAKGRITAVSTAAISAGGSGSGSGYGAQSAPSTLVSADLGKPIIAQSGGTGGGFSNATIDAVSSSLLAAFKFDSLLLDSSGNGHALSNTGSVSQATGKSGQAASFSGSTSQYLTPSLPSQTYAFSVVSGWINPSTVSSDAFIFSADDSTNDSLEIRITSDGKLHAWWRNTSSTVYDMTGVSVSASTWTHFVAIADDTYIYLYLNGALADTTAAFSGTHPTASRYRIGIRADGSSPFSGLLDELSIWRGTSSLFADASARLAFASALYNSGSGRFYTAGLIYDKAPVSWQRMIDNGVCDLRLTLSSTDDAPSSDITAATTLYALPAKSLQKGNRIALYDATLGQWLGYIVGSSGLSVAIPSTTATNYDAFACNSGTVDSPSLALELVAWTDATTRATALYNLDGVYVKTGDYSRRYLGTIRTTGTSGQCEDSAAKRFVWNAQNRTPRLMKWSDSTSSWQWNSLTWRQTRAAAANKYEFVLGQSELLDAILNGACNNVGPGNFGIGLDSATANSATPSVAGNTVAAYQQVSCQLRATVSAGYHYAAGLERSGGTTTYYGDNSGETVCVMTGVINQ